jgi:hypothetical protein
MQPFVAYATKGCHRSLTVEHTQLPPGVPEHFQPQGGRGGRLQECKSEAHTLRVLGFPLRKQLLTRLSLHSAEFPRHGHGRR